MITTFSQNNGLLIDGNPQNMSKVKIPKNIYMLFFDEVKKVGYIQYYDKPNQIISETEFRARFKFLGFQNIK